MRAEFCIFESNAPGLQANFYEPYVDKPKRYAQQKTFRQIACNLCVSADTVSNIVMLYETTGSLSPRKPVKSSSFSHQYAFSKKEISHAPSSAAAVLCENAEVFEL